MAAVEKVRKGWEHVREQERASYAYKRMFIR